MMNKIIKKIWGAAIIVILLSSFFTAVPQASADAQDFSYATLPSDPTAITAPGVEVYDFAVAPTNINTIYAATSANALKSTDGGRTWTKIRIGPAGTNVACNLVVIAPDDENIVAYVGPDMHVRISFDGGASFFDLGIPQNQAGTAATRIFDIDVSKEFTDLYGYTYRYVGVAGVDGDTGSGHAAFYYYQFGTGAPFRWYDAVDDSPMPDGYVDNDACFFAVKFSPVFNIDNIVYLLSQDNSGRIELHVCSLNIESKFDAYISGYLWYDQAATGGTYVINTPVAPVTKGQIIFDPGYCGVYYEPYARNAYCSVATTSADNGGAFRISENLSAQPSIGATVGHTSIWSIGLNDDGSNFVAAAAASNTIYGSDGLPIKRIGGVTTTTDNMTIAWAGAHLLCAKAGDMGALSLSTDDGATFNDISLVNTTMDNICDHVIEQTAGIERYIVSNGASTVNGSTLTSHTSVWYWDGTYWERIFVRTDVDNYIIRVSPENFGIIYLGDTNNNIIYYSDTHGKADWRLRAAPIVGSNLVDMEVVNNTDLYVATNFAGTGYVCPLTWTGLYWNASDYISVFGTGTTIASITLISDNEVLAGSQTGQVAYTATGGHTPGDWNLISPLIAGTSVYADATSCTSGSIIYAVSSTGSATVWTYVIGSDATDWEAIYTSGLQGASVHSIDILIYGAGDAQCIYYLSGNGTGATANVELARAFLSDAMLSDPYYGVGWLAVQDVYEGGRYPNALKISIDASGLPGNQVWFIDTHGANRWPYSMKGWGEIPDIYPQIVTYTDELAAILPDITSPIDGYIVQVNQETGIAYDVALVWSPTEDEVDYTLQYTLQVAADKDFNDIRLEITSALSPFVIGPHGADAANGATLFYQPGEIYYWRVRTTVPYLSVWSDVRELDIQAAPIPVPVLYSPLNDAVVNTLTPSFSWSPMSGTDNTSGITTIYTLQIGTDPDFGSPSIHEFAITNTTGFQMPDGYIADGHTYYWRVCTDVAPHTNWSATFHFKVDLAAGTTTVIQTSTAVASTILVPSNATNTTIEQTTPTYLYAMFITCAVLVITIIILVLTTKAR
jgi:hypothetical protein